MRTLVLIIAVLALAACGNSATTASLADPAPSISDGAGCAGQPRPMGQMAIVDYVDFVMVGDATFSTSLGEHALAHPSSRSDLGAAVATVQCRLEDVANDHVPPTPRSGDAAFLAPGTVLHAAAGFDPACRLIAVDQDGHLHVYLADDPDAKVHASKPCALDPAVGTD
jgi:hypothetical protein